MNEQEILNIIEQTNARGFFKPTWESLMQARVPDWFRQRRLGIFTHWGVYSVPAYSNEWYSRNMYIPGSPAYEHHIKTYGAQKNFGYKDFIPMFTAEKFDAESWIDLFCRAGAGYIFPVAEHHDGFQMYGSCLSEWNAVKMGPRRDVLRELKQAAEARGMVFCTSSHRAEHWFFMGHGREFDSDIHEPMAKGDFYWPAMPEADNQDLFGKPYPSEEFLNDWLARTAEIILNYQPALLYFDWWIQHEAFKPYLRKLSAFYYNCGRQWGRDVMICYKHDAMMFGSGIPEIERGGFAEAKPYPWQTDTAVARNSWCYTDSLDYKNSREIICTLADTVSKGGNLLMNIGPRADGSIPDGDRKILEDMSRWMQVNGEAVNGTCVWRRSTEGSVSIREGQFQDGCELQYTSADYRFTAGHGAIYAIAMKCPDGGHFTIKTFADSRNQNLPEFHGIIRDVKILGFEDAPVRWSRDSLGLHVTADEVYSDFPVVLKITTD